jgi:hypothetical protein
MAMHRLRSLIPLKPELDWNENMPGIRIAVDEDDPDAGRYAVAVMAATLAMATESLPDLAVHRLRNGNQGCVENRRV